MTDSFTTGTQIAKKEDKTARIGHKAERGPPTEGQTVEPGPLTAERKGEIELQTGETRMRTREAETHAGTVTDKTITEVGITLEDVHQVRREVK